MTQVAARSPGLALLKAAFARLKADLPHRRVKSRTPKNPQWPYIAIGFVDEIEMWAGNSAGSVCDFDVQCFSKYYGVDEVETMKGEVIESITRALLDLSGDGYLLLESRLELATTILDPDQETWISTIRFSAMIDDTQD